jgi:hypothetical protein
VKFAPDVVRTFRFARRQVLKAFALRRRTYQTHPPSLARLGRCELRRARPTHVIYLTHPTYPTYLTHPTYVTPPDVTLG